MSKFWFLCTILYFTMYMYVWSSMCNITMYSNGPFHCSSTSQKFCQERGVHIFDIKKSILMMKICLESCSQLWLVEVFHITLYMYSFSYCLLMTDKRQRSKCKTRFCLNPRAVSFACTIIHSKTWKLSGQGKAQTNPHLEPHDHCIWIYYVIIYVTVDISKASSREQWHASMYSFAIQCSGL